MASARNGTLYTGVTSSLPRRVWEHKQSLVEGFTDKYSVKLLVWYEQHDTIEDAIAREKQLKNWQRAWKIELIEGQNPNWQDLYESIL